jgi:hypothetical protein
MELSPAQRKITFALVVFALAGLGVYLLGTGHRNAPAAARPPAHRSTPAASPVTSTGSATAPASAPATPSAATSPAADPNVYQWLPFTKAGLASAAALVVRFGNAYGTFSYTESTTAYLATMKGLITSQLAQQIAAAYSTLGVRQLRISQKQVSAGSAVITRLQAFGPSSITFIVTVNEHITATADGGQKSASFAVTATGAGSSWQVSGIEEATVGQS